MLLRSDFRGTFSDLIKRELHAMEIAYSDPDVVTRMLAEPSNRWMLEILRLVVYREDSLAWASLLELTSGVGPTFFDYVYGRARESHSPFGAALLAAYEEDFAGAPAASANRARTLVAAVLAWLDAHPLPDDRDVGWGQWMIEITGDDVVPAPSDNLWELLLALDEVAEPDANLGRYLGQIAPLGRDRAANESEGVRVMTSRWLAASDGKAQPVEPSERRPSRVPGRQRLHPKPVGLIDRAS